MMIATARNVALAVAAATLLAACDFDLPTYDGGKAAEAEQGAAIQSETGAAAGTYLGESMNARSRAQKSLGAADDIRKQQVREELEFDSKRR